MKNGIRTAIFAAFIFSSVAFAQAQTPPPQASAVKPKLNGLERGEAQRRQDYLQTMQRRVHGDQKEIVVATNALASAKTAKQKTAGQERLTAAQKRLASDAKSAASAQFRVNDWNSTTIKVHHGDPHKHKIDWKTGQVLNQ